MWELKLSLVKKICLSHVLGGVVISFGRLLRNFEIDEIIVEPFIFDFVEIVCFFFNFSDEFSHFAKLFGEVVLEVEAKSFGVFGDS